MKALTEIVVPQLAESLVSATIDTWLKKPGDTIDMYEPICEVLTDKVSAELPSTVKGTLKEILVPAGETVPVGTPICIVETEAAAGSRSSAASASQEQVAVSAVAEDTDQSMRHRYSPAVQKLAAEHGVRLADVPGTGLGGRITRKDVLAYVESGAHQRTGSKPAADPTVAIPKEPVRSSGLHLSETPRIPSIEVERSSIAGRGEDYIDVTPIRNTIARNMRQSVSEIPHAWTMIEVDVTNLVMLRNKVKDEFIKREGVNLTYLAFLLKAVVNAIKDYPIMNSMWAVDKIIVKRDINLSLAVGTDDSVLTPVIKNADHKTIAGLARDIDDLARKTREGKLTLSDMQGGTFTVNNTGSFGSILSYPIINYPQAAILTFESIVKRPVVINDMIAVRSMANLCLSLDHRILDGVICGRFLQRVKDNLESFNMETKLY
ncbi:dihydrolipoamide acetyltransferase family protein [Paenibacillus protaetiae]|uniref:Dihydrolipoamide acetyltransferase component of pyruvate dehydrogenase complex n=1 Tax=Paenibacillus protaetiae TaxID=2509456 RepID=A0A4P6EZS2_9BACL|nr:dihydrolipoamide acetyltransferase family protein [Paenibacillus protaetiae]QAY66227.1 2-oxo acid dehydrogenase subunit E2 [Paenibacillus protaetiae]